MRCHRDRWPPATAGRLRDRALLWDLDALLAVVGPDTGLRSRRSDGADPDGLVTCLGCGRRFRSLGPHLARAHQMTAARYRTEHRLPTRSALMAPTVRRALSAARIEAMDSDPQLIERMRAATPPSAELVRRSAAGRARTDDLPSVRSARRAGALRTLPAAQQARREAVEARARAAGFPSMATAIDATRHLSGRAACELIGVGETTVRRWRRRTGN
ncbi:MucR family transcriptional regulator [Kitasatospora sp. NPDC002040]|uniref:MucR family transcriptional regulator n=1 Tax=Kitasatospora sp. NPDC002040 TaxID=3154661 RepID=UPI003317771F